MKTSNSERVMQYMFTIHQYKITHIPVADIVKLCISERVGDIKEAAGDMTTFSLS